MVAQEHCASSTYKTCKRPLILNGTLRPFLDELNDISHFFVMRQILTFITHFWDTQIHLRWAKRDMWKGGFCSNQKCFCHLYFQDWVEIILHYYPQVDYLNKTFRGSISPSYCSIWVVIEFRTNDFLQKCIAAHKDLFESDWSVEMHYLTWTGSLSKLLSLWPNTATS